MAPETTPIDAQNPNPSSTSELHSPSNGEMSIYQEEQASDDIDSSCSTPYVSAPSSPGRGSGSAGFFYSAPASPMHFALCAKPSPSPSPFTAASPTDPEFEFSARLACCGETGAATSTMISADELFLNGQIRPMKLSTHLQRPQPLAPLPDTDTETDDGDGGRGRDPRLRARSLRRTRSLSPLRQSPRHWNEHDEEEPKNDGDSTDKNAETAAFSSSSNRSSKRWIFLKDLLYRSKSEGSGNSNNNHSHKSWSFTHVKPKKSPARKEAPAGKRKVASASPGEVHYTAKRAQAEELRKRTFLPYKQGLLGCLGFSHRGYGLARALNPVSSR